jgi:hypothetical protein
MVARATPPKKAITNQLMDHANPVTRSDLTEFSARILATRTFQTLEPKLARPFRVTRS